MSKGSQNHEYSGSRLINKTGKMVDSFLGFSQKLIIFWVKKEGRAKRKIKLLYLLHIYIVLKNHTSVEETEGTWKVEVVEVSGELEGEVLSEGEESEESVGPAEGEGVDLAGVEVEVPV